MPASTVHCFVLEGNVTVVTNVNGVTLNVVCPEYDRIFRHCKRKRSKWPGFAGKVAFNMAKLLGDELAGTRNIFCEFTEPTEQEKKAANDLLQGLGASIKNIARPKKPDDSAKSDKANQKIDFNWDDIVISDDDDIVSGDATVDDDKSPK